MAASRRMTVSGSTLRPGARQSVSESWESRWRAWVDSMTVFYLPPNASVLADQKEVLTGWPSSPGAATAVREGRATVNILGQLVARGPRTQNTRPELRVSDSDGLPI